MLDICEPVLFEECLIVGVIEGVINNSSTDSGALDIIDAVADIHGVVCDIFDLNRCSYGSTQRVRVSETRWRSGWNEPVNVNVKNTGVVSFSLSPLNTCQSVQGKHTARPDALVPRIHPCCVRFGVAIGASVADLPTDRRVYNLVCLCIIYGNALRIQVRERKKENKRRCEKGREGNKCRHSNR